MLRCVQLYTRMVAHRGWEGAWISKGRADGGEDARSGSVPTGATMGGAGGGSRSDKDVDAA